jgi:hypothetical protein
VPEPGLRARGDCQKATGLDLSLYKILQILGVTVFEKTPILEGFSNFSDEFTEHPLDSWYGF